jgi:hypothetical protein
MLVTYADNGNGIDDLLDFDILKENFAWINNPSAQWLAALGQKYGNAPNQDWFNVSIVACQVPESSTLILLGVGLAGVGLLRRRFIS